MYKSVNLMQQHVCAYISAVTLRLSHSIHAHVCTMYGVLSHMHTSSRSVIVQKYKQTIVVTIKFQSGQKGGYSVNASQVVLHIRSSTKGKIIKNMAK